MTKISSSVECSNQIIIKAKSPVPENLETYEPFMFLQFSRAHSTIYNDSFVLDVKAFFIVSFLLPQKRQLRMKTFYTKRLDFPAFAM